MLQYICQNPSCSAPENKKGKSYPAAMDCPFCDEPLVQSVQLDETEITLLKNLPYLIAYPLQDTFQQNDYEKKLHRLAYTFNNFLKYLGLISISEFMHSDFKSRKMIDLFESNIGEPSFGRWNQFIRESYALLIKEKVKLVFPEVYKFYQKANEKKFKIEVELIDDFGDVNYSEKTGMTAIDMLINFRNKYLGHGTPLSDKQARALWDFYYPIFKDLLVMMSEQLKLFMYKKESESCWKLQSTEITETDAAPEIDEARVWLADDKGRKLPLIPFFIIPTLLGDFERESKLMVYEAYNGQSMKFFSPENIVKETSGEILQRLKLLLREKQREIPYAPENFGRAQFLERLTEENNWVLETLLREKKIIEGVYQQRQTMEIKLREWIGARANIFFIAAEAGSGKTNLLVEMLNQYKERNIPCLFIRAARMQKDTLQGELAYRLNIDENHSLEDYNIAGTQAEPTIILLDGLNEAKNSEGLWDEILQRSKQFEPGGLKFVVGNRANAKDDLNRYAISEADEILLYGEKKENEKGLYAYAHWLTPMDMQEMKGAWDHYYQLKKGIYRPNFDFDKIAQFDRGIYNQISNPLVMRLFLELYHGKSLPKKGRHLNIWKDWFNSFSAEEQRFMQNLAALIWEKGANELLFDTVQKSELMKAFFTDEKSKIPYQRLLKNGWISRYSKDLDAYIAFTVEGLLLHVLGIAINSKLLNVDYQVLIEKLDKLTRIQINGFESYLKQRSQVGDLDLVLSIIESGKCILVCVEPILEAIFSFGADIVFEKMFMNKHNFEAIWKLLLEVLKSIEIRELSQNKSDFLRGIIKYNNLQTKESILIAIKSMGFSKNYSTYKNIIDSKYEIIRNDADLLLSYATEIIFFDEFDIYSKELSFRINLLETALFLKLKNKNIKDLSYVLILDQLSTTLLEFNSTNDINLFKKVLKYQNLSLKVKSELLLNESLIMANSLTLLGKLYNRLNISDKAILYYKKAIDLLIKYYGSFNRNLKLLFLSISNVYFMKSNFDKALEYCFKSLETLKYGNANAEYGYILKKIGKIYYFSNNYEKSFEYFLKFIDTNLIKTEDFAVNYIMQTEIDKIATLFIEKDQINYARKLYARLDMFYEAGLCCEDLDNNSEAFSYYLKAAEIRKEQLGIEDPKTIEVIEACRRLAKELNREGDLPDWMN